MQQQAVSRGYNSFGECAYTRSALLVNRCSTVPMLPVLMMSRVKPGCDDHIWLSMLATTIKGSSKLTIKLRLSAAGPWQKRHPGDSTPRTSTLALDPALWICTFARCHTHHKETSLGLVAQSSLALPFAQAVALQQYPQE